MLEIVSLRCPVPLLALVLLVAVGCSNSGTVNGKVSYDGKEVPLGFISFLPEDGRGPSAGGPITDGRYQVADLQPGKKKVQIISARRLPKLETTPKDDDWDKGPEPDEIAIPADAPGNGQIIEVVKGSQTIDFSIKKPAVQAE